jgi:DNA-binding protein YbaB
VAAGDAKQLSRLLQEALNQALDDSREMAKKRLGPLSAGLNI